MVGQLPVLSEREFVALQYFRRECLGQEGDSVRPAKTDRLV